MVEICYQEVLAELLGTLPEIQPRYEKDAWLLLDQQGGPTLYSVSGLVLKPFLTETSELSKDSPLLTFSSFLSAWRAARILPRE